MMQKFDLLQHFINTIALVTLMIAVTKPCPLECTCKWKGGKRKVECSNSNLDKLLIDIEPETQVLDYSKNKLTRLSNRMFESANLTNLQKLYLSECHISHVHDTAFAGLTNLIELDLGSNSLTSTPTSSLQYLPLLMKLNLASNPIRHLAAGSFLRLKYLTNLDLSNCHLETIEKDAFHDLDKLDWLKLDGNRLNAIRHPQMLPRVTSGLSLHNNPWRCDCNLRPFYTWLQQANVPVLLEPHCMNPVSVRNIPVAQLKLENLACAPYVIPSSLFVEIAEGKNISFVCQVNAVPEASITWEFEGNPIGNNKSVVYPFYKYYAEEATTEQVSELFVFDAKKENNGTYRCVAENLAGTSTSNFTLHIILNEIPTPEPETVSYMYILVSSFTTLLIITLLTFIVLMIACCRQRKRKRRQKKVRKPKPDPSKDPLAKNPDLIINAEGNVQEGENCEQHLLLIPENVRETYITVDGKSMKTRVYDSQVYHCNNVNGFNINYLENNGTIQLYLSPNQVQNVYINPLGDNVPIPQNSLALQLDNASSNAENGGGSIKTGTVDDEFVNLRHNQEGYPYPSKLKMDHLTCNTEEFDVTPILSPPEPFKTDVIEEDERL